MSNADRIEHLVTMANAVVQNAAFHLNSISGYLTKLEEVANDGGFVSAETLEYQRLCNCAVSLRETAAHMESVAEKLLENHTH